MDEKRRQGYVTGIVCFIIASILIILVNNFEWNASYNETFWILSLIFGLIGIGSISKPEFIGGVVMEVLKRLLPKREDVSESHVTQIQHQSPHSMQMSARDNAQININMDGMDARDSEALQVYSQLHTMLLRINRAIPRETARRMTVGGYIQASTIDYNTISTVFNQHSAKFRARDVDMWLDIEKEINSKNGFFLGRDRQRWFDELEAEYHRRRG